MPGSHMFACVKQVEEFKYPKAKKTSHVASLSWVDATVIKAQKIGHFRD